MIALSPPQPEARAMVPAPRAWLAPAARALARAREDLRALDAPLPREAFDRGLARLRRSLRDLRDLTGGAR